MHGRITVSDHVTTLRSKGLNEHVVIPKLLLFLKKEFTCSYLQIS